MTEIFEVTNLDRLTGANAKIRKTVQTILREHAVVVKRLKIKQITVFRVLSRTIVTRAFINK